MSESFNAIHPGEILFEEYMVPKCLTSESLSKVLGIPRIFIVNIIGGRTSVTPHIAYLLSKFFDTTVEYWMNMQASYNTHVMFHSVYNRLHSNE